MWTACSSSTAGKGRVACYPWLLYIISSRPPIQFDTLVTGMQNTKLMCISTRGCSQFYLALAKACAFPQFLDSGGHNMKCATLQWMLCTSFGGTQCGTVSNVHTVCTQCPMYIQLQCSVQCTQCGCSVPHWVYVFPLQACSPLLFLSFSALELAKASPPLTACHLHGLPSASMIQAQYTYTWNRPKHLCLRNYFEQSTDQQSPTISTAPEKCT